jgi:hypothetical protein
VEWTQWPVVDRFKNIGGIAKIGPITSCAPPVAYYAERSSPRARWLADCARNVHLLHSHHGRMGGNAGKTDNRRVAIKHRKLDSGRHLILASGDCYNYCRWGLLSGGQITQCFQPSRQRDCYNSVGKSDSRRAEGQRCKWASADCWPSDPVRAGCRDEGKQRRARCLPT